MITTMHHIPQVDTITMLRLVVLFVASIIALHPSATAFAPTSIVSPLSAAGRLCRAPTRADPRSDHGECQTGIQNNCPRKRSSLHGSSNTGDIDRGGKKERETDGDGDEEKSASDAIFWAKQRALAAQLSAGSDANAKGDQREKFARRRLALTSDTLYFSVLIASALWIVAPNPFVAVSYLVGALAGTAYSFGLGKFVETIGGSIDDIQGEGAAGAGLGQARFAFLVLLFVLVGKFRSQGLLEIPSIMGFFTYQLASLGQGLREIDD